MKTLTVQIDPATLTSEQCFALRTLNAIYYHAPTASEANGVSRIDNRDVVLGNDELVTYHVVVNDESPTFEGDAFFREDFLCGIMDVLDDYK